MTTPATQDGVLPQHAMSRKLRNCAARILERAPEDNAATMQQAAECIDTLSTIANARSAALGQREAEVGSWKMQAQMNARLFHQADAERTAAESRLGEAERLLRDVLERDGGKACRCICHSRKAELEYEAGNCPHQRVTDFFKGVEGG